jgi:photosystem II stability/assembly factor-like uncharacterized protein
MGTRVAIGVAAVGLIALGLTTGAPARTSSSLPRSALAPNAVAFRDAVHGVLGTGWTNCGFNAGCTPQGTLAITADGGKTWKQVRRTPRPVVALTRVGAAYVARYDDGETLQSSDGRLWRPESLSTAGINTDWSVCPQGMTFGTNAGAADWSLCTTQPAAGNQGKAVYREGTSGWKRVAYTPFAAKKGYGGISSYGYPIGIAGNADGFGLIWESRGTLYATTGGGRHWHGLAKVVRPEIDFGSWAFVLPHGNVGYVVLTYGGSLHRRLIETTDAGRTWRIVHRWR